MAYKGHIDLLPIIKKKYISFTKHVDTKIDKKIVFIDSYRFLASSVAPFFSKDKLRIL